MSVFVFILGASQKMSLRRMLSVGSAKKKPKQGRAVNHHPTAEDSVDGESVILENPTNDVAPPSSQSVTFAQPQVLNHLICDICLQSVFACLPVVEGSCSLLPMSLHSFFYREVTFRDVKRGWKL